MKPFKIVVPDLSTEPVTLRCTHAKLWPPPLMTLNIDIEQMWAGGEISQHDYQQIETWRRICGVLEMGLKCVGCPLAKLEKPRLGHEHHGHKDIVGLHDAIRKAITDRNKLASLAEATPRKVEKKAVEKKAVEKKASKTPTEEALIPPPTASASVEPGKAMPFDAESEEFRNESVQVTEPDYPVPENGNGSATVENFEAQKSKPEEDDLDELLEGLDD